MAGSWTRKLDCRSMRVIFDAGSIAVQSDAELIRLFRTGHRETAEAAFEVLIARHGTAGPILRGESATIARCRAAPGCASPGESGRVRHDIKRCTELT